MVHIKSSPTTRIFPNPSLVHRGIAIRATARQDPPTTGERSGGHLGHLGLGFGIAVWVNETIQDEEQEFSGGMRLSFPPNERESTVSGKAG
jgi:hypothetical protein